MRSISINLVEHLKHSPERYQSSRDARHVMTTPRRHVPGLWPVPAPSHDAGPDSQVNRIGRTTSYVHSPIPALAAHNSSNAFSDITQSYIAVSGSVLLVQGRM